MKTYIVFIDGIQTGLIRAQSHNDAEQKAQRLHSSVQPSYRVTVEYTEI